MGQVKNEEPKRCFAAMSTGGRKPRAVYSKIQKQRIKKDLRKQIEIKAKLKQDEKAMPSAV